MVDEGCGRCAAKFHSGSAEDFLRRSVRLVNPLHGKLRKLGAPAADVFAARVEFFTLARGVEHAEVGCGVGAAAGGPLPAERVLREIGVHKRVPEPPRAFLP